MKRVAKLICVLTFLAMVLGIMQLALAGGSENESPQQDQPKSGSKSVSQSIEKRLENAVALYIGSSQAIVNNKEKQVDSTNAKVKPYIKNDRTMVPVRFISENLGAQVEWDAQSSKVTVSLGDRVVVLTVGSKTMKVGDKTVDLDVAPELNEDRTYLPLRGLVEGLGKKVFYDRGLIIIGDREDVFDVSGEKALIDEVISRVNNLPVVGTYENLEKMFEKLWRIMVSIRIQCRCGTLYKAWMGQNLKAQRNQLRLTKVEVQAALMTIQLQTYRFRE